MAKFKLEFISPKVLNNLKSGQFASKVVWGYNNVPNTDLTIDTDDWNIECVMSSKKGNITEWLVNEETNQMILNSEENKDGYSEIEYPFAISMLGQLVDRTDLIRYLVSLQNTFDGLDKDKSEEQKFDDSTI